MNDCINDRQRLEPWLRLHLAAGVGAITFARLIDQFGDPQTALAATAGQLATIRRVGPATARQIVASRTEIDTEAEFDLAEKLRVRIITLDNPDYPPPLRQIHDAPPVLYVKGQLARDDHLAIAIVGSRNCSQYGREQASRLAHLLAAAGFTIVSGLARGIDTAAHRGALTAEGRTIAVQGCGLANVFPPENQDLADRIAANGAVISELPLAFEPLATTFPMRNRIISGLSLATIVIEARPRSGALITARLATEQNREVMAVPGRVDAPGSFGPHSLIKDGAKLVTNIEDILDALGPVGATLHDHATTAANAAATAQETAPADLFDLADLKLTQPESTLYNTLDHEHLHVDQIINLSNLTCAQTNAALISLQLKGLIKQLPGGYYQKRTK